MLLQLLAGTLLGWFLSFRDSSSVARLAGLLRLSGTQKKGTILAAVKRSIVPPGYIDATPFRGGILTLTNTLLLYTHVLGV